MNVFSGFDGMRCGRIALEVAGVPVTQYFASEIDKHAIRVGDALYPEAINVGDITKFNPAILPKIDLVIGGSPCQGLSCAGTGKGLADPRSKLFFNYIEILAEVRQRNPDVKFLLENVKMNQESMRVFNTLLGVKPVFINSALVSPQNRQRWYWANWDFGQPEDRGMLLKDIIESGAVDRDKSYCIDANYFKGGGLKNYLHKKRRQVVFTDDDGRPVRKLTVRECGRAQTVPEHQIDIMLASGVSNTQLYKMLGNGWTIEVLAHILRGLL